jgi:hypothetical protein
VPVVADEDVEAIAIERQGQAVALGELVEQRNVAVEILGRAEGQGHDRARGIVDGAERVIVGPRSSSQAN